MSSGKLNADYIVPLDKNGRAAAILNTYSKPALKAGSYYICFGQFSTGVAVRGTLTAYYSSSGTRPSYSEWPSSVSESFNIGPVSVATLLDSSAQYSIAVPSGATKLEVTMSTSTAGADVDLYVRYGAPPIIQNSTLVYDYASVNAASDEKITVTSASAPPLQAGVYYIALLLKTTGMAGCRHRARRLQHGIVQSSRRRHGVPAAASISLPPRSPTRRVARPALSHRARWSTSTLPASPPACRAAWRRTLPWAPSPRNWAPSRCYSAVLRACPRLC